jgi:hypothetical protein
MKIEQVNTCRYYLGWQPTNAGFTADVSETPSPMSMLSADIILCVRVT